MWRYGQEFRIDKPEKDKRFDLNSYKDWLEEQLTNCRKQLSIPVVSNSLDLRELERKLDEALGKETRETLTEWLKQQRQ